MNILQKFLHPSSHDAVRKVHMLLLDFMEIYELITKEGKRDIALFEKWMDNRVNGWIGYTPKKDRNLWFSSVNDNYESMQRMKALLKKLVEYDQEIIVIIQSPYVKLSPVNSYCLYRIKYYLSLMRYHIYHANRICENLLYALDAIKASPDQEKEYRNLIGRDWLHFNGALKWIRLLVFQIQALDSYSALVIRKLGETYYVPFFSERYMQKWKTDTFVSQKEARKRYDAICWRLLRTENFFATGLPIETIGDFKIFGRGGTAERTAFYVEGNKIFLCEPLFHNGSGHNGMGYDGDWIRKATTGAITRKSYGGWTTGPFWIN